MNGVKWPVTGLQKLLCGESVAVSKISIALDTTNRMSNMKSSIFGRQLIKFPVTGGRQFAVEPR